MARKELLCLLVAGLVYFVWLGFLGWNHRSLIILACVAVGMPMAIVLLWWVAERMA